MESLKCACCGVEFYLACDYVHKRRQDQETFYCPNGHGNVFNAITETDKLKRQVENQSAIIGNLKVYCDKADKRADRAERKLKRLEKEKDNG